MYFPHLRKITGHTFILFLVLICHSLTSQAQVTVSANQTALALAQKLAGPGITILNPTLSCAANGNGLFKVVTSNLGLDSGIILTTGRAVSIIGASGINASTNNGTGGDPQLAALANSTTFDACKLEFDLIPKGDTIRFDYVFGSEEYNTSTCGTYNDAFAFFISGPGITGQQNIALVPGTTIPVAVNSINSGVPGSQGNISNCTSMGAGSPFTAFYVNNAAGTTIAYRGFTTVLRAVSAVQACSTYHLKLTIADAGNPLYDSGVFIRAGSLKTNTYTISNNVSGTNPPFIVKGCSPRTITIKRSQTSSAPQTIHYTLGGSAVNGTDYSNLGGSVTIPANDSVAQLQVSALTTALNGTKTIKIYLLSPYSCNGIEILDSTSLDIYDGITTNILTKDTILCKGTALPLDVQGNPAMTYSWSPATGLNNATIQNPVAVPDVTTTYVLTTTFPNSGCVPKLDSVRIQVQSPPAIDAGPDQSVCEGNTVQLNATITGSQTGTQYEWTGPLGFTSNVLNPVITATTINSGTYIFTVSNTHCPSTQDSVTISIGAPPAIPEVISPVTVCLNMMIPPSLRADGKQLTWYTSMDALTGSKLQPIIPTGSTGILHYYVSQTENQCESGRADIEVIVEKCCDDNVFIPSAFTPNADGKNDKFNIHIGPKDMVVECNVFNRWGQLIFHGRSGESWDGTYGGQTVELGTYFYDILIDCNSGKLLERKGEVTVLR